MNHRSAAEGRAAMIHGRIFQLNQLIQKPSGNILFLYFLLKKAAIV